MHFTLGHLVHIDFILTYKKNIFFSTDPIEFTEGEHKVAFQVPIPPSAGSSFQSMIGSVKYKAKVIMKRPGAWKFDQTNTSFFDVREYCDLNLIPHLKVG